MPCSRCLSPITYGVLCLGCADAWAALAIERMKRGLGRATQQFRTGEVVDPCVHFVGFRGEEYWSAVRIWGLPDFYHRVWDQRARREVADYDLCVFAKYDPEHPSPYNFDDSNEPGDPAARERASR